MIRDCLTININNSRNLLSSTNDVTMQHHPPTQAPGRVTASGLVQAQAEAAGPHPGTGTGLASYREGGRGLHRSRHFWQDKIVSE